MFPGEVASPLEMLWDMVITMLLNKLPLIIYGGAFLATGILIGFFIHYLYHRFIKKKQEPHPG
ncbi:hypothetical protein ACFL24_00480 [Patescibacteria group bacterium]